MPDVSSFCPACGLSVAGEYATVSPRDKLLGAIAYVGIVPAIVLLLVPALRRDRFVRFHSWQSVLFSASSLVLALALKLFFVVFSVLPVVGFLLAWLSLGIGSLGIVILWIALVVKAAQGHGYELPFIGSAATRLVNRTDS